MNPASSLSPQAGKTGAWFSLPVRHALWPALVLIGAVVWIYWPSLHGAWIGDDRWYLPNNPLMSDPARLWKAWFAPGSWVEFYPIEESAQWFQWNLWHNDTLGYHATNVVLHILNSFLVWYFLSRLGLRLAWVGALLFAVHPETVDSVAEMVELKNTLSFGPFIVAMCFYMNYDETKSRRSYLWALTFFIVAMLCKVTMMAFPFVILLYAWWKRQRIKWEDFKASLPFFAVSLALVQTTIWSGAVYAHPIRNWDSYINESLGGPLFRLALSGQVIAFYFFRVLLPINPMPIYPKWPVDPTHWASYLPWVVIILGLAFLWSKRPTWGRHALLGVGFFLIMLSPFFDLHYISYMNATWILDHSLYIPIIGLVGLVAAASERIQDQLPASVRPWSVGVVVVAVVLLTLQSHAYASRFTDEGTLCRYNLRFNESEGLRNNLGCFLEQAGYLDLAHREFDRAIADNPSFGITYSNLAGIYLQTHQADKAIEAYYKCVACAPEKPESHAALADTLFDAGRMPEALEQYQAAADLNLKPARMYCRIGEALFAEGKPDDGMKAFQHAVDLDPTMPLAQYNMAKGLCQTGQIDAGIKAYERAIQLYPAYAPAHNNLAIAFARQGHMDLAVKEFRLSVMADPNFTEARQNLEAAERMQGASSSK